MKKIFIITICLVVLLIGSIVWYALTSNKLGTSETTGKPSVYETNTIIPVGKLKLIDGSFIPIPEFIVNNEANINLAQDVFRDIAGNDYSNYHISYLPYNGENSKIEFNIILNRIPLSKTRLEAESALRTKLGLSDQELCKLDISVYVFRWVDEKYSEYDDLGLSFCTDAITVP